MFRYLVIISAILLSFNYVLAEDADKKEVKTAEQQTEEKKELKIEDFFPEKSVFGPSASGTCFSFDGRYGAYLYRPYKERRHGNDIYLLDTETGKVERITFPSVMAKYQADSRKVVKDRKEKAESRLKEIDKKLEEDKKKKEEAKKKAEEEKKKAQAEKKAAEDKAKETKQQQDEKELKKESEKKEAEVKKQDKTEKTAECKKDKEADCKKDSESKKTEVKEKKIEVKQKNQDSQSAAVPFDPEEKKQDTDNNKDQDKDQEKKEDKVKKDSEKEEQTDNIEELKKEKKLIELGDWVTDKDADDDKAPRYSGISDIEWSPGTHEFLFTSGGEIYLYKVKDKAVQRLTQTRDREYSVKWLPEADGFTFRISSTLYIKKFESSYVRQLDPKFPSGDSMNGYRLSQDGKRIVFLTWKEIKKATSSTVEIADYNAGRLMKAKEVARHVSDDPLSEYEWRIYLYDMSSDKDEEDLLTEVFKGVTRLPSDKINLPVWSPDSNKIAFIVYDQDQSQIIFYESEYKKDEEKKEDKKDADDKDSRDEKKTDEDKTDDKPKFKAPEKAKEIYRFLHTGGPNTPSMIELYYLADNKKIVYLSEQTGYRNLHVLDPLYESFKPLASGPFEIYPIEISKDRKWIFAQSTKIHPSQTDIYKISTANGKMIRLTKDKATYSSAAVSQDGSKVLTNEVSYDIMKELVYIDSKSKKQETLTDSHPDKAKKFVEPKPEFFDFKNRHGHTLYGLMFKPDDWKKTDKRPMLIYFYGGPLGTRKQVTQGNYYSSVYAFAYYMAQKHGYVCCTIDTRGNSGYAGIFEKANFNQVGKPQVEDIVDCVKLFVDKHGVDEKKVAIHGWSFGGFQTQMCMYTEPDVFAAGIAGAGPTEWENYNSWYTRHAIGESEPGKANLKKFSLLPLAKNLKGRLLLVHGVEDSNVLYQDTVHVYRELLKAGKETLVELFLDPTGGHGLGGDVKTLGRYRKYEHFLLSVMGKYEAAKPEEKTEEAKKPADKKQEKKPAKEGAKNKEAEKKSEKK